MTINAIKSLIKGPKNTSITLETSHLFANKQVIRNITVKRKQYHLNSIHRISANHQIPYLRINKFISRKTLSQLKNSLQFLKRKTSTIVLDLRETSGGDLYEALDCLSLFLLAGKLLATNPDNRFCNGEGLTPDIIVDDKQLYETHTLILKGKQRMVQ